MAKKMNFGKLSFSLLVVVAGIVGLLGGFGFALGIQQATVLMILAVLGVIAGVLSAVNQKKADLMFIAMLIVLMLASGFTVAVPIVGAVIAAVGAALLAGLVPYAVIIALAFMFRRGVRG